MCSIRSAQAVKKKKRRSKNVCFGRERMGFKEEYYLEKSVGFKNIAGIC